MERDFMGLGSRDNYIVKEEAVKECKELEFLAFSKGSAVQWPSSNETLVPPHFMAFKPTTDESIAKLVPSPELQKVDNGPRGFPFSVPNQAMSASMSNFGSHFGGSVQNFAGVTMKQQSIEGSPVLRPYPIHPFFSSVSGGVETRFNSKPSESPQLTIFYGGTLNVFDNISPEKAQAILFLARNLSAKVLQPPVSKQGGGVHLQVANTTPNSRLPSPITISSHPIVQTGEGSRSKDEITLTPIKPLAVLGTPKIPTSTTIIHSAVPQARKASLARFLEKRKERATFSTPYNTGKISRECAPSGSNNQ